MLCEKCHKREATCHVCNMAGGVKSSDLCDECYEASSPEAKDSVAALREARCEYCGGQPCAGGTDILALMTGEQKMKFMCMPCSMEHNRYMQQQLRPDAAGPSQQEQLAALRTLHDKADEHMKKWVSHRDS